MQFYKQTQLKTQTFDIFLFTLLLQDKTSCEIRNKDFYIQTLLGV